MGRRYVGPSRPAREEDRELVELIQGDPDRCRYTGGLGEADIVRAEAELLATFPLSYRLFLAELGSCEAGGSDFLGVYRTTLRGDRLLGTVSGTLDARDDERFPLDLLVVQYDGMGGLVCLDLGALDTDGEAPVVVWDPGAGARGGPERLADNLGDYALRICRRALESD